MWYIMGQMRQNRSNTISRCNIDNLEYCQELREKLEAKLVLGRHRDQKNHSKLVVSLHFWFDLKRLHSWNIDFIFTSFYRDKKILLAISVPLILNILSVNCPCSYTFSGVGGTKLENLCSKTSCYHYVTANEMDHMPTAAYGFQL